MNTDKVIALAMKSGRNLQLRDVAMNNARTSRPEMRGVFVQIARLHNQYAVDFKRLARAWVSL